MCAIDAISSLFFYPSFFPYTLFSWLPFPAANPIWPQYSQPPNPYDHGIFSIIYIPVYRIDRAEYSTQFIANPGSEWLQKAKEPGPRWNYQSDRGRADLPWSIQNRCYHGGIGQTGSGETGKHKGQGARLAVFIAINQMVSRFDFCPLLLNILTRSQIVFLTYSFFHVLSLDSIKL